MPNISTYFKLGLKQKDLDFVDVTLDDDNLLFVDPRLIENSKMKGDALIKNCLYDFFGRLILKIATGKKADALELLKGVDEPRETRLGYGEHNSNGRSAGKKIKRDLIEAILNNPVIKSKNVSSLSDMIFFIPNMGIDRMSDITTKIIKQYLIMFTQDQCRKYKISMRKVHQKDILNPKTFVWEEKDLELPIYNMAGIDKPIIFIPKHFVCREKDANSNFGAFFRFARNFILINGGRKFLGNIPRNGKGNSILKKDFDNSLGGIKDELTKWVINYPAILSNYWISSAENIRPLSDDEIGEIVY